MMVDLLEDRIILGLVFIFVGIDVFGLWEVCICRIRGGVVNSKRWGLMFICLILRVVYIEVIEEMLSLCFINVLCRFLLFCGLVKIIRFD